MIPPLLLLLAILLLPGTAAAAADAYIVLCYHDVRDDVDGDVDLDPTAVGTDRLAAHFQWLRENGYNVIGLDDIAAAREGARPLPKKAVLLTFDDGLRSFYTRVFPLLKLFDYPAVLAVVGAWLEAPSNWTLDYPPRTLTRSDFVSWEELREMQASGLVEIASHTYDLHRGILANPSGNEQPAGATLRYDSSRESYESETAFRIRIRQDLTRSAALHEKKLGLRPRAVVWPYGAFSDVAEEIARELGMTFSFALASKPQPLDGTSGIHRILVVENPPLDRLIPDLLGMQKPRPVRVAHVDLDYVYDPDPEQQERNLDLLVERIKNLRINTVYLQAFADPDGDGTASALYFPNRHLPMRGDLFNRVSWQLRTRAGVEVFAWMPVLAFDLPDEKLSELLSVEVWEDGERRPSRGTYRRLSPYKPQARRIIGEIYEDLARYAPVQGLLFHDDAYLDSTEDAAGGTDGSLPSVREKTLALLDFTDELTAKVRRWRPAAKTARNLYARVVLEPESEGWFAQNLELFLSRYDQTALMAMPYMEEAQNPRRWLAELTDAVARVPGGLEGTVFELQTRDWRTGRPVAAKELAAQMRLLLTRGAVHLGYYPDDFHSDHPDPATLRSILSVETFPYRRP